MLKKKFHKRTKIGKTRFFRDRKENVRKAKSERARVRAKSKIPSVTVSLSYIAAAPSSNYICNKRGYTSPGLAKIPCPCARWKHHFFSPFFVSCASFPLTISAPPHTLSLLYIFLHLMLFCSPVCIFFCPSCRCLYLSRVYELFTNASCSLSFSLIRKRFHYSLLLKSGA